MLHEHLPGQTCRALAEARLWMSFEVQVGCSGHNPWLPLRAMSGDLGSLHTVNVGWALDESAVPHLS